ncbi:major sperm protein, putative [Brugia malayi]|uniref:Major sperm protein n=1 Tax=Brugia malayi TaxID=6279 RepID=A0A1S0T0C8_BRUMA|nr:major sperm protein, putative [Brugia malayi]CTP81756.1 Bm2957 [Brugia malayi]VIO96711.1 major sperm protein, putative [Brugia malayi]
MGDAPAEGAPPPEAAAPPAEGAPLAAGVPADGGAPPEAAPPPAGPPTLNIDPPAAQVPAAGGQSVHQIANPSGVRLAFKVKSTNNNDYRLKPVYGFVEPGATAPLEITRTAGPPKEDKFVIQFKEAAADAADPTAIFKGGPPVGEVTLPIMAQ